MFVCHNPFHYGRSQMSPDTKIRTCKLEPRAGLRLQPGLCTKRGPEPSFDGETARVSGGGGGGGIPAHEH